jgi:hypothetical protein
LLTTSGEEKTMLAEQVVSQRFEGLEILVGGRKKDLKLEVIASGTGVTVEAMVGNKRYKFFIASSRLARHIFFSSGRTTRDSEIGNRLAAGFQMKKQKQPKRS